MELDQVGGRSKTLSCTFESDQIYTVASCFEFVSDRDS
jgi:hypothetical protein